MRAHMRVWWTHSSSSSGPSEQPWPAPEPGDTVAAETPAQGGASEGRYLPRLRAERGAASRQKLFSLSVCPEVRTARPSAFESRRCSGGGGGWGAGSGAAEPMSLRPALQSWPYHRHVPPEETPPPGVGLHRGPCDTWGPPFPKPVWISTCLILPGHLMDPLDGLPSDRGSCRNPCICHQGVKEAWRSWEDRVPLAPAEPDRHPQPLLGRPPVHPALQVRGSLRAVGPASRVTQEASVCLGSLSVCGLRPGPTPEGAGGGLFLQPDSLPWVRPTAPLPTWPPPAWHTTSALGSDKSPLKAPPEPGTQPAHLLQPLNS